MAANLPRRARLVEFALAATLVALASLFLLAALATLQEDAEKLAVELTVRNMNSGLFLRQAELVTSGRENELPALAERNPFDWLGTPPAGYVGTRDCPAPGVLAAGQWCWDERTRQVYYQPRRTEGLKIDGDLPWLTWRVQAPADPRAVRPGTIRVVSVGGYTWRP